MDSPAVVRSPTDGPVTILCVVGARPNFIKIAPIVAALKAVQPPLRVRLVHTGQHYDVAMNERFFQQLHIPAPDVELEVGSGSHATQTAEIMRRFEPVLRAERPAAVLVVGDVNSTIATALVAAKEGVPVFHVEAGLRSFDRSMPEEINRVLTDQLCELLFTTERRALDNLVREGIDPARVHFVGNVMIDTLLGHLSQAVPPETTLGVAAAGEQFLDQGGAFGLVTLHRPSNVDDPLVLARVLGALRRIADELPLVFPIHPRSRAKIDQFGLDDILRTPRILCLPPQGYLEMLGIMVHASLVLTDSGGVQEETTALGIPCLTLRENTERPITVEQGTNLVVGTDPEAILAAAWRVLGESERQRRRPEFWDGQAARRIADVVVAWAYGGAG